MRVIALLAMLVLTMACSSESDDPTGAELFADNCSGCHGAQGTGGTNGQPNIQGKTLVEIQNALANVTFMQALGTSLSDSEVEKIADHVGSLGAAQSKLTALVFGTVELGEAVSGTVEIMGNKGGTVLTQSDEDGAFEADISDLTSPYVIRFSTENGGGSYYGFGLGNAVDVSVSEESDDLVGRAIDNIDDVFESCESDCFGALLEIEG